MPLVWSIVLSCCLLSCWPTFTSAAAQVAPTVKSHRATFFGLTDPLSGVDSFLGVPYARPPVASLRLQPPVGLKNKGMINATSYGAQCFQMDPNDGAILAEDCLTLNIWKPDAAALKKHSEPLPVMFWIHGGGFNDGTGSFYDGSSLVNTSIHVDSPVIVVTINYRLSFFGFSAGREAIKNSALNLGLLDQRVALQWVQDQIAYFGGDPKKVTIFGESAGATSIGLQMLAYDGDYENLFRAAILESGSPQDTSPTPPPTWPPWQAAWDGVANEVNCTNSTNVFSCVQNAPQKALFQAITKVGRKISTGIYPWQPVVDGDLVSDYPTVLLAKGNFVKIPTIVGFTTDEVTYAISTKLNISSDAALSQLVNFALPYVPPSTLARVQELIPLSTYPNLYSVNGTPVGGSHWKRATELAADVFERCPGIEFARNVSLVAPVWKYRFNAIIPAQLALHPEQGIVHSAEIPYVFGPSLTPAIDQAIDINLSLTVQKAWISFATHLNPNTLGDLEPGVGWPNYYYRSVTGNPDEATEQVLVFQKNDGSGNVGGIMSAWGSVGQGLHTEKDLDDKPVCDFIISRDPDFVH